MLAGKLVVLLLNHFGNILRTIVLKLSRTAILRRWSKSYIVSMVCVFNEVEFCRARKSLVTSSNLDELPQTNELEPE